MDKVENDHVTSITTDNESIWIGTKAGVGCFSRGTNKWSAYRAKDGLLDGEIAGIASFADWVWFGGAGRLVRLDKRRGRIDLRYTNLPASFERLTGIAVDSKGIIWAIADNKWGQMCRFDGSAIQHWICVPGSFKISDITLDQPDLSFSEESAKLLGRLAINYLRQVRCLAPGIVIVGGGTLDRAFGIQVINTETSPRHAMDAIQPFSPEHGGEFGYATMLRQKGITVALDTYFNPSTLQGIIAWGTSQGELFVADWAPGKMTVMPRAVSLPGKGFVASVTIYGKGQGVIAAKGRGSSFDGDAPQIVYAPLL